MWIPPDEDVSFERAGLVRAERFAAARGPELAAAADMLPPRAADSAARLARLGAPPARMPLRRRAASFRPYKMPLSVRLSPGKRRKLASGAGVPMLCRARRRATRLLMVRQQPGAGGSQDTQKPQWLATHLWHSKRMKMGEMCGFRVALERADAGKRAAVRWARTHATLYDESHHACLELTALEADMLRLLRELTWADSAVITADCRAGGRETDSILHASYCRGGRLAEAARRAVSPVRVLWKPVLQAMGAGAGKEDKAQGSSRVVWVWVPAVAEQRVQSEIMAVVSRLQLRVECVNLQRELARFQVRGPVSHSILAAVLQLADVRTKGEAEGEVAEKKSKMWQKMREQGPSACVAGGDSIMLQCQDPRMLSPLPHHCIGGLTRGAECCAKPWLAQRVVHQQGVVYEENLCAGGLWDESQRGRQAPTQKELGAARQRGLITAVRGWVAGDEMTHRESFSVLLVRVENGGDLGSRGRVLAATQGSGVCGWDMVVPRQWALVLWVALVKCGCRALALRENQAVERERGQLCFPQDFPDTECFEAWAQTTLSLQQQRWEGRARGVRVNYHALRVAVPWVTPEAWRALVSSPTVLVVRGSAARDRAGLTGHEVGIKDVSGELVRVNVEVLGRGVPSAHARVTAGGAGDDDLTLGYITSGWYDFCRGRGVGVGFLSVAALHSVLAAFGGELEKGGSREELTRCGGGKPRGAGEMLCLQVHVRNANSARTISCRASLCP